MTQRPPLGADRNPFQRREAPVLARTALTGRRTNCARRWLAAVGIILGLALSPAPASARKPIIAYVDQTTNKLVFYDAEMGTNVAAPKLTIPRVGGRNRFAVSSGGRYVAYEDAMGKIHLVDRAVGGEVALPGINIDPQPDGLSVSDTGSIAFDNNSNGPAVVYDGTSGAFVSTGLSATNGHRQTHLSADGKFLATTCVTGSGNCAVDSRNSGHSTLFVQNLTTRADTGLPLLNGTGKDEEHPCIDGNGGLVGADVKDTNQKDVFIFSVASNTDLTAPFLNVATKNTVHCVLSAAGDYVGVADEQTGVVRVYQTSNGTPIAVPAAIASLYIWFTSPYAPRPPPTGAPPPPPPALPAARSIDHISALTVTPSTLVAASNGPPVVAAKRSKTPKTGAIVSYTGTQPATTTFTVQRPAAGRRQGRSCVKPGKRNRRRKRCTRYLNVGDFTHTDTAGANKFRFTGRIHGRKLKPRKYRLRAIPRNTAGTGPAAYRNFRVKK